MAQQPEKKPNILVIWGDDIGIWNLSCYSSGMMGYQTPNIDRIAKEGMRFTSIILSVLIVLVLTQVQAQEEKPAGKRRRRQSRNGDDYRDGRRDRGGHGPRATAGGAETVAGRRRVVAGR
jgi:hypothetical protein